MQERPTIIIKLKPHLQEFLRCKLNEDDPTATKRNFVGILIRPFLSQRPADLPPDMQQGPSYMKLQLPIFDDINVKNGNVYMSTENQGHFEKILDAHFRELFYNYLDDKVRYLRNQHTAKGSIKKCILQFCSDYNMSFNSTTYDMLQKAYYRRRRNITKKPPFFSSNLSAISPLFFLI